MHYFNNMKISVKLIISFSLLCFITGIVGLFGVINMSKMNVRAKMMYEQELLGLSGVKDAYSSILEIHRAEKNLILSTTDEERKRYIMQLDSAKNELKKSIDSARPHFYSEKGKDLFSKLDSAISDWLPVQQKIVDAALSEEFTKEKTSIKLSFGLGREKINVTNDVITSLTRLKEEYAKKSAEETESLYNSSRLFMLILILSALLLGMTMGFFIARIITRQLGGEPYDVVAISERLAKGDFTVDINIRENDSTSALYAMKDMRENLETMVTKVIISSQNLVQAVDQISMGNQNLSQRTSEQASALEEVAATIEEANSSISLNSENSKHANEKSDKSSQIASRGGQLVEEAVMSINEVNASAKKIGEIINVINEISFQTNLLALNAAVEAARAGEQGRGFAVVAGEVRNLAQRSGNAAKEIAHLINDTILKVEDGTEKTYKSGDALKEIISSVKTVAEIVSEINASSNEQKQGMDQITIAISDLDSMTQHNAALVEETASASEEMASQAQMLNSLMTEFKIRNNSFAVTRKTEAVVKKSTVKYSGGGNGSAAKDNSRSMKELQHPLEKEGFDKF